MTSEAKQQYEGAILNQLVKSAEKIAVIEFQVNKINAIEEKVNNIEEKVNTIEERVNTIESDVSDIKEEISEIRKTTNQIESLIKLVRIIGGFVIAIFLSVVANFVYSFIS